MFFSPESYAPFSLSTHTYLHAGVVAKTGQVVEEPGHGVKHISGANVLDNHSVNLLSNLATALTVPWISIKLFSLLR